MDFKLAADMWFLWDNASMTAAVLRGMMRKYSLYYSSRVLVKCKNISA
jgi:hypothetical protein